MTDTEAWEARGTRVEVGGHSVFVIDGGTPERGTVLFVHGFPNSSYTFHRLLPLDGCRVVLVDMPGYGLSGKRLDRTVRVSELADAVQGVASLLGIEAASLVLHDLGDSVGGELCARSLEGALPFEISTRVVTNGSIYMDLVQLSPGQQFLLSLPDETLPEDQAPGFDLFRLSLASTFGTGTQPDDALLEAEWRLLARAGGNRILPRLIRYVEERRVHEGRWTGALERHPSPLVVVWGDADPIAVYPMAERLHAARPDASVLRLEGIGHYPMLEAPERVRAAILTALP